MDIALKLLKAIEKNTEMQLQHLAKLLPKKYNDHRDFYALSYLIEDGLIGTVFDFEPGRNQQASAMDLFAAHNADNEANYQGRSISLSGGNLREMTYHLTSK